MIDRPMKIHLLDEVLVTWHGDVAMKQSTRRHDVTTISAKSSRESNGSDTRHRFT